MKTRYCLMGLPYDEIEAWFHCWTRWEKIPNRKDLATWHSREAAQMAADILMLQNLWPMSINVIQLECETPDEDTTSTDMKGGVP